MISTRKRSLRPVRISRGSTFAVLSHDVGDLAVVFRVALQRDDRGQQHIPDLIGDEKYLGGHLGHQCLIIVVDIQQHGVQHHAGAAAFTGRAAPPAAGLVEGFGGTGAELFQLLEKLSAENKKVILFGVSFALLDYLDFCNDQSIHHLNTQKLTVIETGGMKGRKEEMTKDELLRILQKVSERKKFTPNIR